MASRFLYVLSCKSAQKTLKKAFSKLQSPLLQKHPFLAYALYQNRPRYMQLGLNHIKTKRLTKTDQLTFSR